MPADLEPRRLLLTALPDAGGRLEKVLGGERFREWSVARASSIEEARFLLQHRAWDGLLLEESLLQDAGRDGLAWIMGRQEVPVILLASPDSPWIGPALESAVLQWLPREAIPGHPLLLALALKQAAQVSDLRRRLRLAGAALHQGRRQVDQLVGLLWRTLPADAKVRWHAQRSMMERLHEEVERARRYGKPLSVILGEWQWPGQEQGGPDAFLRDELVGKAKRASDVAGQYGPHGFLLLLVDTPESGAVAFCRRLHNLFPSASGAAIGGPRTGRLYLGLASYSAVESTPSRLLYLAEMHLEAAKNEGTGLETAV